MSNKDFLGHTPETVAVDGSVPKRIAALPRLGKYRIPFFVGKIDGEYDFRSVDPNAIQDCHTKGLCWICGQPMNHYVTFVVDPIKAINRVSSEPPSHIDCAIYAAKTSPFMVSPARARSTGALPKHQAQSSDVDLSKNPGVALVWVARAYNPNKVMGGVLFEMGPYETFYFITKGRRATAGEVIASIDSAMPDLKRRAKILGGGSLDTLELLRNKLVVIVLREIG